MEIGVPGLSLVSLYVMHEVQCVRVSLPSFVVDIIYAEASSSAPGPATDVSVLMLVTLMLATLSMLLHWNF